MATHTKKASKKKNERHSAVWGGKPVALLILVLSTTLAFAQSRQISQIQADGSGGSAVSRKFSPDLVRMISAKASANQRVIVQYKNAPTSSQVSRVQAMGGRFHSTLALVRGGTFTMSPAALRKLAADPNVAYISPDRKLKGMDDLTDAAVGVAAAWNAGYDGSGVGVAVIDSGINDNHTDLADATGVSRVVYHQDFTGTSTSNSNGAQWDLYGHGTHVAGIIGGNGDDSNGRFAGMAPNVKLIDLRVLDQNGGGSDSMVIAAIQRAIQLKNTYNIRVINLSLGRGISTSYVNDPLCQAVEQAWRAGIVVVVAAGNYGRLSVNGSGGYGTVTAPGNDPLVLTVGAMKTMSTADRSDDQIASYSSKGPTTFDHVVKPDIVAPGNTIVSLFDSGSTLAGEYPGNKRNSNGGKYYASSGPYFVLSGTSMASPAAAGAVALLLQQNPALTPDQVKARLMKTAYKTFPSSTTATDPTTGQTYTSYYDLFTVGAGYMDLGAALANNDLAPVTIGSALSPTAVYDAATGTVTVSNGNSTVAGSSVVWGTSVVWGSSVVWGTNVAGSSVVWG